MSNGWGSIDLSHCDNAGSEMGQGARNACIFWYFIWLMMFKADFSFLLGDT